MMEMIGLMGIGDDTKTLYKVNGDVLCRCRCSWVAKTIFRTHHHIMKLQWKLAVFIEKLKDRG